MSQGLASDDVLERRQGAETGREPDIDGLFESPKGSTVRSDFKTQHKLHNQLEKKANNSILLPQTSSESLELGFFGKLWMLYITDYIWLPWLKHTF